MTIEEQLSTIKINHHEREPNRPTELTLIQGTVRGVPYTVEVKRGRANGMEMILTIDNIPCGGVPIDNLVKAATRIDPDHANESEKQIQKLREELSKSEALRYEQLAEIELLRTHVTEFTESTKA
jgi:hypothetical protein